MNHRKLTFEELNNKIMADAIARTPVAVVCENIRSLFNVGSFFRTADALNVRELILTGYTGRPPRKEIDKTALGAVDSVPWRDFGSTVDAIADLRQKGMRIVAVEQTVDSVGFQQYEFTFPTALVFGNEFEGVLQETLEQCDDCIEIPMMGVKQSLNVGTAFGIIGYEIVRRLNRNGSDS